MSFLEEVKQLIVVSLQSAHCSCRIDILKVCSLDKQEAGILYFK